MSIARIEKVEKERRRIIEKATESVLKRRKNVYKRLAEGVSDKK